MDLYNKDKKKSNENYSSHQTEFGNISREIDDILKDKPRSTSEENDENQHKESMDNNTPENDQNHINEGNNHSPESSNQTHEPSIHEDAYEIIHDESDGTDTSDQDKQGNNHLTKENGEINTNKDNIPSDTSHINSGQLDITQKNGFYANTNEEKTKNTGIKMKSFSLFSKKKKQPLTNINTSNHFAEDTTEHNIHINNGTVDEEVLKLLGITDELLGKLPEEVINEFASSENFELYKRVMNRYNIIK